ncbi:MAG: hypothetical protein ACE5GV_00500 [Candidatus Scalindua sp.]
MFETLDTMISLGVIFLILSMVNKYLISIVKRMFKIKAKVITKELETFIGEKTSKYLIPYLEEKAKHLNFLDEKRRLRLLSKEQLKTVVGDLEEFMKSEKADEFKKVFGINISVDDIKNKVHGEFEEIKAHLNTLKGKVETMYDSTTEKVSEVFETKIRYRALYFGLVLAFIINADFFGIYNSLSNNSLVREKLVAQAGVINTQMEQFSKRISLDEENDITNIRNEVEDVKANISSLTNEIKTAGLQLGWTKKEFARVFKEEKGGGWASVVYKLIGLLIAGLLISFGAPFWHDFIGIFTGLRKTLRGKKEEKKGNGGSG